MWPFCTNFELFVGDKSKASSKKKVCTVWGYIFVCVYSWWPKFCSYSISQIIASSLELFLFRSIFMKLWLSPDCRINSLVRIRKKVCKLLPTRALSGPVTKTQDGTRILKQIREMSAHSKFPVPPSCTKRVCSYANFAWLSIKRSGGQISQDTIVLLVSTNAEHFTLLHKHRFLRSLMKQFQAWGTL